MLTLADLETLQADLEATGRPYRVELHNGEITVMGPSDIVASEITIRFAVALAAWVVPRQLGRIFDSSGGFILPNADLAAPDVSFVSRRRLPRSPRYFGELVPDLVVEIKSQSDRLAKLDEKLRNFVAMGAVVGLLIDPDLETVAVYRSEPAGDRPIAIATFGNGEILTLPELFPGWELPISELWPPIFEDDLEESDENPA
jgi:Uma2 family endonuclease